MTEEQEALLERAQESIDAARMMEQGSFFGFAASRAYYAMFYVATAMLLERNLRFRRHGALSSAFGREIVKPGIFPVESHGWLIDAADARNAGDYWVSRHISRDEAVAHISRAETLLRHARDHFAKQRKAST